MKSLLTLCLALSIWAHTAAQSVQVEAPCLGGVVELLRDEQAGPDATGRYLYLASEQDLEIRFNSTADQWEIRSRTDQTLFFTASFAAAPAPPNSLTAVWQGQGNCSGQTATVNGDGTQTELNCPLINVSAIQIADESCSGAGDGRITVEAYGPGELRYSIDGGVSFQPESIFESLAPGSYTIIIQDPAFGECKEVRRLEINPGAPCALTATDACICLDNASAYNMNTGTGGNDGTFAETVTIAAPSGLPPGLTFAVADPTSGVFDVDNIPEAGEVAAEEAVATDGSVQFSYVEGSYQLRFVHRSAQGYNLTVVMLVDGEPALTFNIGNTCFYPQARITSDLSGPFCPLSDPILLTGSAGVATGTGTFFINGSQATVFEPRLLPPGIYTVTYRFDAGSAAAFLSENGQVIGPPAGVENLDNARNDPGCEAVAVQQVEVIPSPQSFSCLSRLNVTLSETCQSTIPVQQLAFGDYRCVGVLDYFELNIADDQPANGPVVDGCGSFRYTLTGPAGLNCSGTIIADDKRAPDIICPETPQADYVCTDIDEILLTESYTYTTDSKGNILSIPPELEAILAQTGYPILSDNCGDLQVTVSDEVIYPADDCEAIVINRTFEVEDACGGGSTRCTQPILIGVPDITEVRYPTSPLEIGCDSGFMLDANGNPHPDETGYPTIATVFGQYDIIGSYCNLTASYEDSPHSFICGGSYSIVRIWTVTDWCAQETVAIPQIIKIEDDGNPQVACPAPAEEAGLLTYSTSPFECTAAFELPLPQVSDACSDWQVRTELIGFSLNGPVLAVIDPQHTRFVAGIPIGCHFIKYTVDDDCGNRTITYCPLVVEDQIAPTALCADDLTISLGGSGLARLFADDLDRGSNDNCGDVRIEVRRRIAAGAGYACLETFDYNQNGEVIGDEIRLDQAYGDQQEYYFTPWLEYIDLSCCDITEEVIVEFRVWDDRNGDGLPGNTIETGCIDPSDVSDNFNVCWLSVSVEDKLIPNCIPPPPATVDCDVLPAGFDPTDKAQLQSLFGIAAGTDNCGETSVVELAPNLAGWDNCGFGTIIRNFRVTDAQGQVSNNNCRQPVQINERHEYKIKFPKDASSDCVSPEADTISLVEGACDLLAVSVEDDVFAASADECYKIRRTYRVINWCEYDGSSDPVVVSRDEDCDGDPGDEDVWVIVETREGDDPCSAGDLNAYPHVWYDRDDDPFNIVPAGGTKGVNCDGRSNPSGFWKELFDITNNTSADVAPDTPDHCEMQSRGYWQYTQFISVYDFTDPVVVIENTGPFCSYSTNIADNCPTELTLPFSVAENCTTEDLTITVFIDEYQDGILDAELTASLTGQYPDYQVSGSFPLGDHFLVINVTDGCNNRTSSNVPLEVIDCKAPAPVCINGLAVELMPVIPAADVNDDGSPDGAAMTIWARDFVASTSDDCSGGIRYSINRMGVAPQADQTGMILTCDDDTNLLIEIWAWDEAGNGDFCETYVLIQDNMVSCDDLAGGTIAGTITNEMGQPLRDVRIELSGNTVQDITTAEDGTYRFNDVEEGFDYTIIPDLDEQPLNGVSTFDLVLMSKHILGLEYLSSPYKMIAADVNNSRTITTLDAIQLRRLILSISTRFSNNTSWRFIPRDYVFPDPSNPWQPSFPELINVNDLQGFADQQDFIAVKIGDLNLNAHINAIEATPRATSGAWQVQAPDIELEAGETSAVPIRAATLADVQGFQFTAYLDPEAAEVVDIQYANLQPAHVGNRFLYDGLLTASWHQLSEGERYDERSDLLFTLIVRARRSVPLRTALRLNSRITRAEAYGFDNELLDVELNYESGITTASSFTLYQNTPNPFRERTFIRFTLPANEEVILHCYDVNGRTLHMLRDELPAGNHQLELRGEDLPTGVVYYTLTAGSHQATRRMVRMR